MITGNKVFVKENESIDKALKRFKKKVRESGVLQDLKNHEFYEKPTSLRKRAKNAAINRQKKYQESQKLPSKYK